MAEGAGMALEDALVLAGTVAAGRPLDEFAARRRPRVGFVQTQTHRRDRTRNLTPVARDAILRLAGQRISAATTRHYAATRSSAEGPGSHTGPGARDAVAERLVDGTTHARRAALDRRPRSARHYGSTPLLAPIAARFVLVDTEGWFWIRIVGAPRDGDPRDGELHRSTRKGATFAAI